MHTSYPKIANRIIEWGIIFLIVFTPIAFGTTRPWAYTIMEITVCFLVIIWIIRLGLININKMIIFPNMQPYPKPSGAGITPNSELPDLCSAKHTSPGRTPNSDIRRSTVLVNRFGFIKTPLTIPIIIFVGLILFQLTPLPPGVLKILSPNTYKLYKTTLPDWQTSDPNQQLARMDTNTVKSLEQVGQTGGSSIVNLPQSLNPSIPQSTIQSWQSISVYKHATKTELYKTLAYIGIFFLIVNYNPSTRSRQPITRRHPRLSDGQGSQIKTLITRLIIVLIVVGCFESIYGLLECLSGNNQIFSRRKITDIGFVTGTYVNRNHFAGYMAIVICMSFGYLTYMLSKLSNSNVSLRVRDSTESATGWRQKLSRIINLIGTRAGLLSFLMLIMSSALILSGSRMGICSFIIVIILMSVMISKRLSIKKILLIILPICLMTLWIGLNPVIKRFSHISKSMEAEGSRTQIWNDTCNLIKDFPVLGTGPGTYEYAFPKYKTFKVQKLYDHTHNDYLELMSDTGLRALL